MIVDDNVKNVVINDKISGFELGARLPYYRGVALSMVQEIEVSLDGEVLPQNIVDITVHDNTYNLEQRENETDDRWEMGEVATLTIHKDDGLSKGEHQIGLKINIRIGYLPFPAIRVAQKTIVL